MPEYHLDTCILLWKYYLDTHTDTELGLPFVASTVVYLEELKKLKGEE